jgi:hypothetical protein
MDHFAEAEAWLARGEQAYEQFESDEDPRDVSLLRRAETAARFATAHAALAQAWPPRRVVVGPNLPVAQVFDGETWRAPNGQPIPVSPVPPSRGT